ncbi:PREDICTED: protein GrpE isoform X1 [Theobroma cacao]|uniref:GrpE protein homolog n=1 Tax=Theobroma cacao TaxID=3641 RepID=A0AB32UXS2_THECC|nr:PREDICTED: protein GrpE isoform X1 [Theobroma cacao]
MLMSRALSRVSRSVGARSLLVSAPKKLQKPSLSNQFHSLVYESPNKLVTSDVSLLHHSSLNFSAFQRFGISSSASPEPSDKEHGSAVENNGQEPAKPSGDMNPGEAEVADQAKESGFNSESQNTMPQSNKRRRRATKRTAFSDSDSESDGDLSMADMVKIVEEKEELLKAKQKEIEQMQDKVVRTLAEMENVMARTRREAENSKKFAIQNFAKGLLDVADNLGRASTHVKGSFSKIDESKDTVGAVPLLKTLLEGVEMTEKQLGEVFRKFGVEKFDPTNEPFDPHRHNAVFQVPDNSKPPGTVAHVLKAGYMLYDRVIRPAEVGVTQELGNDAAENNTSDKGSEA